MITKFDLLFIPISYFSRMFKTNQFCTSAVATHHLNVIKTFSKRRHDVILPLNKGISSGILQRACVLSISFQYGGRRRADFHLTCNSDILNCLKWSLACEERAILSTKCTKWLPILCIMKVLCNLFFVFFTRW